LPDVQNLFSLFLNATPREREILAATYASILPQDLLERIQAQIEPVASDLSKDIAVNTSSVDRAAQGAVGELIRNFDANGDGILQREELRTRVGEAIGIIEAGRAEQDGELLRVTSTLLTGLNDRLASLPDNLNLPAEVVAQVLDADRNGAITQSEVLANVQNLMELLPNVINTPVIQDPQKPEVLPR